MKIKIGKKKSKLYFVTSRLFGKNEGLTGYQFPSAGSAEKFAQAVRTFAAARYRKDLGLEGSVKHALHMDVVSVEVDSRGAPVGGEDAEIEVETRLEGGEYKPGKFGKGRPKKDATEETAAPKKDKKKAAKAAKVEEEEVEEDEDEDEEDEDTEDEEDESEEDEDEDEDEDEEDDD